MTTPPRKKRVWTVADFAQHAYNDASPPACRRARRALKALDAKHGGKLLIPSAGTNREYTFYPSRLAKLEPDLFTPVESLEFRIDELEDDVADVRVAQKRIVSQVGQNTRDIDRLRRNSAA